MYNIVYTWTGSVNATKLDNYISFHENLLGFYESFVVVYRIPIFSLLWPLLRQLQPQVCTIRVWQFMHEIYYFYVNYSSLVQVA